LSRKVHNFKDSLAKGKKAEAEFLARFGEGLEQTDGRRGDFKLKDGSILELKTDFYDPTKTPNFFMERYSYDDKPGGCWQAKEHGAKYYAYTFAVQPDTVYVFEVETLLERLEEVIPKCRQFNVRNVGHTTVGFLVPRDLLLDLAKSMEDIL